MRHEKALATLKLGPGGRRCPCCAHPPKVLKRLEHRVVRRRIAKIIRDAITDIDC